MKNFVRVGVIEIGGRSIRLLVADCDRSANLKVIRTLATASGLAEMQSVLSEGRERVLERLIGQVKSYQDEIERLNVGKTCVFGTEGLRALPSAEVDWLKGELPNLVVLEPNEEARYSLLVASQVGTPDGGPILALDQGGSSMEIVSGTSGPDKLDVGFEASEPLGSRVLSSEFTRGGCDVERFTATMDAWMTELILPDLVVNTKSVLLGSAPTKLAWLDVRRAQDERYDPKRVHNHQMPMRVLDLFLKAAGESPDRVRRMVDPMRPTSGEFETVVAGLVAIRSVLRKLGVSEFFVCAHGTRHGVAIALARESLK
jgi:exopolyphosphatase/pppGpp-phosphohydrolase